MHLDSNLVAILFGLLGAVASVAQILKQLHSLVAAIHEIKSSVRLAEKTTQADIALLNQMVLSNREDYTEKCEDLAERVDEINRLISKYLTLRRD